ncbi:MAG: hypothetical protein WC384_02410 [Prolixibacteraceae bacterium]
MDYRHSYFSKTTSPSALTAEGWWGEEIQGRGTRVSVREISPELLI